MTTPDGLTAESEDEAIARAFHEAYERLAPQFGYRTREASAVPWDDVPQANRDLMVATVASVKHVILARHVRDACVTCGHDEDGHDFTPPRDCHATPTCDCETGYIAASPATEEDTCRPAVLPHHWPAARVRQDESGDMTTETYCWRCGVALASPEAGLLLGLDEAG